MGFTIADRVATIYERKPHYILPYIGAAYHQPHEDDLRVLALGINSYVSEKDWPPKPEWHRGWIETRRDRYQKGVARELSTLTEALAEGAMFAGLKYDRERCLYATNLIKVYMLEERGKRAADLVKADFAPHLQQWHDELAFLIDARVPPHVVVVFSKVGWPYAWQAFHPNHHGTKLGVAEFQPIEGDAPHRLNRVVLEQDGRHELLIARLRHPSRAAPIGTARWLCGTDAFAETIE